MGVVETTKRQRRTNNEETHIDDIDDIDDNRIIW